MNELKRLTTTAKRLPAAFSERFHAPRLASLLGVGQKADAQSAHFHFEQARAVRRVGDLFADLDAELLRDLRGCPTLVAVLWRQGGRKLLHDFVGSIGVGDFHHRVNAGRIRRGDELDASAGREHLDAVISALVPLVAGRKPQRAEQLQRRLKIIQRLAEHARKNNRSNHDSGQWIVVSG